MESSKPAEVFSSRKFFILSRCFPEIWETGLVSIRFPLSKGKASMSVLAIKKSTGISNITP